MLFRRAIEVAATIFALLIYAAAYFATNAAIAALAGAPFHLLAPGLDWIVQGGVLLIVVAPVFVRKAKKPGCWTIQALTAHSHLDIIAVIILIGPYLFWGFGSLYRGMIETASLSVSNMYSIHLFLNGVAMAIPFADQPYDTCSTQPWYIDITVIIQAWVMDLLLISQVLRLARVNLMQIVEQQVRYRWDKRAAELSAPSPEHNTGHG